MCIKIISLSIFLLPFFLSNDNFYNKRIRGYMGIFGCCFDGDSVVVKSKNKIFFSGRVTTESSTSIDIKSTFLIKGNRTNKIEITLGLKKIELTLRKNKRLEYIYVYSYKDSLFCNITAKPLYGQ